MAVLPETSYAKCLNPSFRCLGTFSASKRALGGQGTADSFLYLLFSKAQVEGECIGGKAKSTSGA